MKGGWKKFALKKVAWEKIWDEDLQSKEWVCERICRYISMEGRAELMMRHNKLLLFPTKLLSSTAV